MTTVALDWSRLLSSHRLADQGRDAPPEPTLKTLSYQVETRTPAERDYDRLRFAAPVRRLADKTQVFPLERNDSVRTRLTHSEEVSAIARSIGLHLAHHGPEALTRVGGAQRQIPALLAAAALGHDLGNPPFGHQGEVAIREWFAARPHLFGEGSLPDKATKTETDGYADARGRMNCAMRADLRNFEGNAQTLRLVTTLQSSTNGYGLNLTCATLATLMKYTALSDRVIVDGAPGLRKVGFFASEQAKMREVREQVGLPEGVRHPLTYILEACDDIAYSVVDAEDSVKKGLVSFPDLIGYLDARSGGDEAIGYVVEHSNHAHAQARSSVGRTVCPLTPAELNDVSMQRFRVHAIGVLVSAVIKAFLEHYEEMMAGQMEKSLLDLCPAAKLVKTLKRFDYEHAYRHKDVLAVETRGHNVIQDLMSMLWRGISERHTYSDPSSRRTSKFADLAYSHISDNYRTVFESSVSLSPADALPVRYCELQLLADVVAGMTDTYALELHNKLLGYHVGASHRSV